MIEYNKPYKYRHLCEALGIETLRGGYQKNQLADLNLQYEIIKDDKTKQYTVIREYTDVEKISNKKYRKTKGYLTSLLYTLISNVEENTIHVTLQELMYYLAIVNHNYIFAKRNKKKTEEYLTKEQYDFNIDFIS